MLHSVVVASYEDSWDSEVVRAVGVQLVAVTEVLGVALAVEVVPPGVASLFPQEFAHWDINKVHYRTPAALRMEANRTPDLALLDFPASTQRDSGDFELVPMLVVEPASLALEVLEQEGLVEVEQEVGATVEQLELDYTVDFVELGQ